MKLLGFAPDLDPTTPGILKSVNDIIPSTKGFRSAPSALSAGLSAVSAAVNSLVVVQKLDGSRVTYAGTATTLEEAGSSSWTDRSGATYNCGTDSRWSFAQFGDITLASNKGDPMQYASTGAGAFADVSGAPQAAHIAVSDGFVMAVNTTTAADQWHCSAYLDYSDWTEAVSTQCTSGRVIGGGGFTGVRALGSGFVAWKKNATYVATYVGAPVVWQWDEVPGGVGCEHQSAAVDIGDRVAFLGNDDFYIFDGANNIPIGQGIREWFFENADSAYLFRTIASYNPVTGNIFWYFVSTESGSNLPDYAVVYNIRTQKWGKIKQTVEAVSVYYPAGLSYEGLGSEYSTYDDLPTDISYDSPYWTSAVASAGLIKSDHILYTLTGTPGQTSFTMNTFGDDEQFSTITRVRPRFITAPVSSTIEYSYDNDYGDLFTDKSTYDLMNGKYDLLYSARWHQVKFNFVGSMEITEVKVSIQPDGVK